MTEFLYFIEANLAFALLYTVYRLTVRRGRNFTLQRIYLLACLPLAILLPKLNTIDFGFSGSDVQLPQISFMLEEIVVGGKAPQEVGTELSISIILIILYSLVSFLGMLRVCFSVFKLKQKLRKLPSESQNGYRLVFDPDANLPYSFFHYIFLQHKQRHNTEMLTHEMAHARQLHSVDKLVAEFTLSLLWINPVVYLWRQALVELHEYLADQEVLLSGTDPADYGRSLVSAAYRQQGLQMASFFNKQFTKKRLIMIQNISKTKSSHIGLMATLLIGLFIAFACNKEEVDTVDNSSIPSKNVAITDEIHVVGYGKKKTISREEKQVVTSEQKEVVEREYGESPFIIVEKMPQYPGGAKELLRIIAKNVKYPAGAMAKGIEGRVYIRFVVEADGTMSSFEAVRETDPELSQAAIDAIKTLGRWTPGYQRGKAVPVYFTVPVNFTLQQK